MSEIQDLFRTPLYKTTLSLDNKSIQSYCASLASQSKGRLLTNDGGWQSNDLTLKEPPLLDLYKAILYHSSIFKKELKYEGSMAFNNCWININGYRDYNVLHKHDHCLLSGVYYVNTPKDCGSIVFVRPGVDSFTYNWNKAQREYNNYNSANWWQEAKTSNLYIFPSWLNHLVEPNLNKRQKRISISFNINLNVVS